MGLDRIDSDYMERIATALERIAESLEANKTEVHMPTTEELDEMVRRCYRSPREREEIRQKRAEAETPLNLNDVFKPGENID